MMHGIAICFIACSYLFTNHIVTCVHFIQSVKIFRGGGGSSAFGGGGGGGVDGLGGSFPFAPSVKTMPSDQWQALSRA